MRYLCKAKKKTTSIFGERELDQSHGGQEASKMMEKIITQSLQLCSRYEGDGDAHQLRQDKPTEKKKHLEARTLGETKIFTTKTCQSFQFVTNYISYKIHKAFDARVGSKIIKPYQD